MVWAVEMVDLVEEDVISFVVVVYGGASGGGRIGGRNQQCR